jgi:hypothetical protein
VLFALSAAAQAQELEPRAYSASPVGTNFAVANFTRLRGDVNTDPALPLSDVHARINVYFLGYVHTFGIAGHGASAGLVVPYFDANVHALVFDAQREAYRAGIGDARFRFSYSLGANTALSPREFAQRTPEPAAGVSLSVIAPTGQYVSTRLVNIGSNRWGVKPDFGVSYPLGDWFVEGSAGAWFFTDNPDFFGGQRREQAPLANIQFHGGYNFRPGFWLAVDAAYDVGGRTTVNGTKNNDMQHNSRYGVTMAVPLGSGWSAKLAWSNGLAARVGGDYEVVSFALQYRWFDRQR